MQGLALRLAAVGVLLPIGLVALLYVFRPVGDNRELIGMLLLVASPPWPLLGTLFPGLLKMQALFLPVAISLNGLLYGGIGVWLTSSRGRPAVLRYGPIVVTWIVLLGIARKLSD